MLQDPRIYLTFKEAAHLLSLSRSMLYKLVAKGELEAVKIGWARRIPTTALIALEQRLKSAGKP
jgi:excisionase family DNA binding protein